MMHPHLIEWLNVEYWSRARFVDRSFSTMDKRELHQGRPNFNFKT